MGGGQFAKERRKSEFKAVDKAGKYLRKAQLGRHTEATTAWSEGARLHLELSVTHTVRLLRGAECKNERVVGACFRVPEKACGCQETCGRVGFPARGL